jgi:hypothetical protein
MQIFVKNISGRGITLEVENSDTILALKMKIEDKDGEPVANIQLMFDGIILEDDHTLSDYNIPKDATLRSEYLRSNFVN